MLPLTDLLLGILELRFKQAKLLELNLELLRSLFVFGVVVSHVGRAKSDCGL